jgi:hypothetical protein
MATTTNYSWTTPDNTAYVKDGASAIRTLGSSVDTTLYTALGGTYPGLRLVKKQTIGSGVSTVTVTNAFSATYENYKILVSGGVASTANYSLVKLGATATGYSQKSWYGSYANNTVAGAGYSSTTSWVGQLKGTTNALNCNFDLIAPFLTKPTGIDYQTKEYAGGGNVESGSGFLNDTTSYTDITFTTNTGTWTGGTIYVYGYGIS